jgi:hypothetical protein
VDAVARDVEVGEIVVLPLDLVVPLRDVFVLFSDVPDLLLELVAVEPLPVELLLDGNRLVPVLRALLLERRQ